MIFSLNKVQLIGSIGQDVEITATANNKSVSKFTLATTHSYKKDDTYENVTTWHNIVGFQLNKYLTDQLKKGTKVYVEGRLNNLSYEKDGQKKYFTNVIVDSNSVIPFEKITEINNINHNNIQHFQPTDDIPF